MPDFDHQDVALLKQESLYQGFVTLEKLALKHRCYSNRQWSGVMERERFKQPPCVAVVAYDPHQASVVMVEQCRVGPVGCHESPWLLEWVAGYVDVADGGLELSVRRELLEETGLQASYLRQGPDYWVSPGISQSHVTFFLAVVDAQSAHRFSGCDEEGEDIKVVTLTISSLKDTLKRGALRSGMTLIGAYWLLDLLEEG